MAENYKFTDRDIDVIKALAECDLCMSSAAKMLHYHCGTIQYYATKIADKTGLCPTKFYDMIELLRIIENRGGGDG